MATIRERPRKDGSIGYSVIFRIGATQTSDLFDDPADAKRFCDLVNRKGGEEARRITSEQRSRGKLVPTLAEHFEHYLRHATSVEKGTVAEYRRVAERSWMSRWCDLPVDAVTKDDVRVFVGDYSAHGSAKGGPVSAKTLANAKNLLSTVMEAAVEAGHRADNPCRGVRAPRGQREEQVFLTEGEFVRLLDYIPEEWKPLILTMAGSGLRWGEVTALEWSDVDLDAQPARLRVRQAWKRGETTRVMGVPKSDRSRRTVTIPDNLAAILRVLPRKGPYVFHAKNGGQVHHQQFHPRVWLPAVRAFAGDEVEVVPPARPGAKPSVRVKRVGPGKHPRLHDLRHSHASWLLGRGYETITVSRRLGHESITTTDRLYSHVIPDRVVAITEGAGLALAGALPELIDAPELEAG